MVWGIKLNRKNVAPAFYQGEQNKFGYVNGSYRDEIVRDSEGNQIYYLHGNKIATLNEKDNTLTVTDAGWQTKTTKDRLNRLLSERAIGQIIQEKGKWYIVREGKRFDWRGSETFKLDNPEANLQLSDMKAKRMSNTKEVYVVQGNYGSGWEDVTEEDKYSEGKERLKEYRENEGDMYAHRLITRRVPIQGGQN